MTAIRLQLILTILAILLFASASKSATLSVSIPDTSVEAGDTVSVHIRLAEEENLFGAGFDLLYDPGQLNYLRAREGDFLNASGTTNTIFIVTANELDGKILAGLTRSSFADGGISSVEDTLLMTLDFEVLVADTIPLTISKSSLVAPDGITKYPHEVINDEIVSKIPTAVMDEFAGAALPRNGDIGQAYPNPFNSTVSFEVTLMRPQEVEINVFNCLGQRVKTIYSGPLSAGSKSLT